jgi:phage host-nuclease inhibitor protein Gam
MIMASRRKAAKQEAPQTIEEAVTLIEEHRDLLDKADDLAADAMVAIGQIEATRDAFSAPIKARADVIFRQLRAWWGVAAPAVTDGKRKSIQLAGCIIGERTGMPKLKLDGTSEAVLAEHLADLGMGVLLRISTKLDKQAAIKSILVNDELGQLLLWLGASTVQQEEFFIDRPRKDPEPERVPVEEADA